MEKNIKFWLTNKQRIIKLLKIERLIKILKNIIMMKLAKGHDQHLILITFEKVFFPNYNFDRFKFMDCNKNHSHISDFA